MADKKQPATIDEYISTFPDNVQDTLQKIRQTIARIASDATEAISYGIPTFMQNGKYVVYFAGWKHHISLYPIPRGDDALGKELAPYVTGKGTVQFPMNQPIPYDLVERMVRRLVQSNKERAGY
jgi:uncharacterized protein YdhG (YjbR/CyaY superfamily)